ncbi:MAG: hypothetical protein ABSG31_06760 [Tepidisphaeraceae bacterium]|jgi:hypothetical protein
MILAELLLLPLVLAACLLGPGLFFVRRLRWNPADTLLASVVASLMFLYLLTLSFFWVDATKFCWVIAILFGILTWLSWRDLRKLLRNRHARRIAGATGIIWLGTVLLLAMIRHYSGGGWSGDWLEHFQRSTFFLAPDLNYRFLGQYMLTERPPMMNLICSQYLALFSADYQVCQLTAALLNALPILPCCLFACSISRNRRSAIAWLILLMACNPMFMQNITYVWTKSFAAFFALSGLWFYLRGWKKRDPIRLVFAFLTLAAGCLVHYYIVPWAALIFGHYLFFVFRPARFKELAAICLACALLWTTWFGWAIDHYGLHGTFASNLTVTNRLASATGPLPVKISEDVADTVVPFFLRKVPYDDFQQDDRLGFVRDLAFSLYQTNAIFAFGSLGATCLIIATLKRIIPITPFWLIFLPLSALLTIATVPQVQVWGSAHLSLQPQVQLGLAMLAGAGSRLGRPFKAAILSGCAIDFLMGILLQVHLENRVFQIVNLANGNPTIPPSPVRLSQAAQFNFFIKQFYALKFVGDNFADFAPMIQGILCVMVLWLMLRAWKASRLAA